MRLPGCIAGADVEELRFAFELIAEAEPAQAVRKNSLMKPGSGRSKVDSGGGLRSAALTAIAAQRVEKARGGLGGGLLGAAMAATAEAALAGARVTAARVEMGVEVAHAAAAHAQPEPAGLLKGLLGNPPAAVGVRT